MKINFSSRALFFIGFFVLIAANIVVMARVAINRSGPYENMIRLTERELSPPYWTIKENSGMALKLNWRVLGKNDDYNYYAYEGHHQSPAWLDKEKLASIGFETDTISDNPYLKKEILPRQAYFVLEYEGEPYQKSIEICEKKLKKIQNDLLADPGNEKLRKEAEYAESQCLRNRTSASRLFAVDAGKNADLLREKYSDRTRFMVVPGIVEVNVHYSNKKAAFEGYLSKLQVESIHVPLEFKKVMHDILKKIKHREDQSPSYAVSLVYGSLYDPWVKAIIPIQ